MKLLFVGVNTKRQQKLIHCLQAAGQDGCEGMETGFAHQSLLKSSLWKPALIVADLDAVNRDFVEVCARLHYYNPLAGIVLVGRNLRVPIGRTVLNLGILEYLPKNMPLALLQQKFAAAAARLAPPRAVWAQGPDGGEGLQQSFLRCIAQNAKEEDLQALQGYFSAVARGDGQVYYRVFIVKAQKPEGQVPVADPYLLHTVASWLKQPFCLAANAPGTLVGLVASQLPVLPENGYELAVLRKLVARAGAQAQNLYVSLGSVVSAVANLPDSYGAALEGLAYSFFSGPSFVYTDIQEMENPAELFTEEGAMLFYHLLLRNNRGDIERYLEELFYTMQQLGVAQISLIREKYARHMCTVELLAQKEGVQTAAGQNEAVILETLEDLHAALQHKVENLLRTGMRHAAVSTVVGDALEYIYNTFTNPLLTYKTVAEHIYVSPTYLATLFKKEMGVPVGEYINALRIERAKKLLCESNTNVSSVAYEVGFSSTEYFSRLFKKATGALPSQYKKGARPGAGAKVHRLCDVPHRVYKKE